MKKYLILTFILSFGWMTLKAQNGYKNPVIPGFYPDPSVCRVGDDYYLVNSSFSYFPGVPIWHSKDLVNWEQIGYVLTTAKQLPLEASHAISMGIFAPTIRYHDGTFYMITTNMSLFKNFIVTAKDSRGPWSDPIWIDIPLGVVIDPSLFFDDDGKVYLTTSPGFGKNGGCEFAEIDVKSGKLLTEMKSIWDGTGGRYPEGPHLYKKDGLYYLMIAEGGTEYGHKMQIARSKNIDGPYEADPGNPILTHINKITQSSPIQGTGHADMVQATDGSWWMVALGFRHQNNHHILGRETFLVPVDWKKGGWPVVNKDGTIALDMDVPTLPLHPYPEPKAKDDFDGAAPSLVWNYINNPVATNYSLSDRPGYLRLKGSKYTLNEGQTVTFAGRRQQHFNFTASTSLDFNPTNNTDEAGLTVFMDNSSHYDISIKNIDGRRSLLLTYHLGMINHVEKQVTLTDGPVQLKVEGSKDSYTFSFMQNNSPYQVLGNADTKYLSSETAGGFTGVYIAMFATGNGQDSAANADFDWFDYEHK
jgi:alpha-N-arabinofuranosidase